MCTWPANPNCGPSGSGHSHDVPAQPCTRPSDGDQHEVSGRASPDDGGYNDPTPYVSVRAVGMLPVSGDNDTAVVQMACPRCRSPLRVRTGRSQCGGCGLSLVVEIRDGTDQLPERVS